MSWQLILYGYAESKDLTKCADNEYFSSRDKRCVQCHPECNKCFGSQAFLERIERPSLYFIRVFSNVLNALSTLIYLPLPPLSRSFNFFLLFLLLFVCVFKKKQARRPRTAWPAHTLSVGRSAWPRAPRSV